MYNLLNLGNLTTTTFPLFYIIIKFTLTNRLKMKALKFSVRHILKMLIFVLDLLLMSLAYIKNNFNLYITEEMAQESATYKIKMST